jgi:hypothetical protein
MFVISYFPFSILGLLDETRELTTEKASTQSIEENMRYFINNINILNYNAWMKCLVSVHNKCHKAKTQVSGLKTCLCIWLDAIAQ